MNVQILQLLEGAKQARGLTVVIDVFRAFSLECYLAAMGAAELRPVSSLEEALSWREKDPDAVLIGERGGAKCEGFDFGNSPSSIREEQIRGRRVIHTTSAGTQGVTHAYHADEIISGSFVNAAAVAEYIRRKNPETASIVCMGLAGREPAREDTLCAEYIKSIVLGAPQADIDERLASLRTNGGEHFFDPNNQSVFPEPDFWLCIKHDIFPFVLRLRHDEDGMVMDKIDI